MEPFLGSDDPTPNEMRYACFVQPPWAKLARGLVSLQLRHSFEIGRAMTSVLHQTTRLRRLSLHGSKTSKFPKANLELALPELKRLSLRGFSNVRIWLNCPQLEQLCLQFLRPLKSLQGLPQTLDWICLKHLGKGSLPIEKIFQEHRLEQVRLFWLWLRPEAYEDSSALAIVEQVLRNGRLQNLSTDCPLGLIEGLRCFPPFSLRKLELHIPLQGGLPVVLEQLSGLKELQFIDTGEGHLHFDRPLDPFLDMANLILLTFSGKFPIAGQLQKPLSLTPDAHKFLGLARQRIAEGDIKPHGRTVVLKVQDQPETQ